MLKIKKILCPTDFSQASFQGLDYAVELARLFEAELLVMHVLPSLPPGPQDPNFVFEIPEYERLMHQDAVRQLDKVVSQRIPKALTARPLIGHGHAAKEIVRVAEEERMDLIVIATRGHSDWHSLVMGSTADKVLRHAPCPVFAVRELRHQ